MDEVEFDAVDGLEAHDVVIHEPVEFVRILIGEEDELAGAEVVAAGILGGGGLAFQRNGPFRFGTVGSRCFVLFVGTHTCYFRFDGSIGTEIWRAYLTVWRPDNGFSL